jgi:type II secretory pathway predicted ATPase ExeA
VPTGSYERYGLTSNPFRDLASESLENVNIFHVNQETDDTLRTIKDEVFDKENRAVVAVVGPHGAGKTERLLVTAAEAQEHDAFVVYFDVPAKTSWVLRGVATEFLKVAKKKGQVKLFSQPKWLRGMTALTKLKDEKYDAKSAGRVIGQALTEAAPSFLLLNDLNNLIDSREVNAFAQVLQEVTDSIKPGVLVMFSCYASYIAWLTVNHPAMASRINRTFTLAVMSDQEVGLLLAKKLLVKRLVEDLDPIYPFDKEAVHAINEGAGGNPRRVLELADLAIEYGVAHRAYRVDADVVKAVLAVRAAQAAATQAAARKSGVAAPTKPSSAPPSATKAPAVAATIATTPARTPTPADWSESPKSGG